MCTHVYELNSAVVISVIVVIVFIYLRTRN